MDTPPLAPEDRLLPLLDKLRRLDLDAPLPEGRSIAPPQVAVLAVVASAPGCSLQGIARRLDLAPPPSASRHRASRGRACWSASQIRMTVARCALSSPRRASHSTATSSPPAALTPSACFTRCLAPNATSSWTCSSVSSVPTIHQRCCLSPPPDGTASPPASSSGCAASGADRCADCRTRAAPSARESEGLRTIPQILCTASALRRYLRRWRDAMCRRVPGPPLEAAANLETTPLCAIIWCPLRG